MEIRKIDQIEGDMKSLLEESILAKENSYNIYSKFQVGAALLCEDGTVIRGCNVENISFGLTICAERCAVVKAVSEGQRKFVAVAVSAVCAELLVPPCGACRQFLAEFNPTMKVYLVNPVSGDVGITTLDYLLPSSFDPATVSFFK